MPWAKFWKFLKEGPLVADAALSTWIGGGLSAVAFPLLVGIPDWSKIPRNAYVYVAAGFLFLLLTNFRGWLKRYDQVQELVVPRLVLKFVPDDEHYVQRGDWETSFSIGIMNPTATRATAVSISIEDCVPARFASDPNSRAMPLLRGCTFSTEGDEVPPSNVPMDFVSVITYRKGSSDMNPSYSSLHISGERPLLFHDEDVVLTIVARHDRRPAKICLRFHLPRHDNGEPSCVELFNDPSQQE